ncbi:MAG: adenylosuccinate lyase, partial [Firmicutes bacterium]|nr:adenylosuccinate lyase [Bacillota bacterium]
MTDRTDRYVSPLSTRYASSYMLELFSQDRRYETWRRLWVSLAKAEMKLGLPITQQQVEELEANIGNIDYECVRSREKEVRH